MKKLISISLLLLSALFMYADNIPESSIPDNVKSYISGNYPRAKNVEWTKGSKGSYKAEFYINGLRTELEISSNGELLSLNEKLFNKDLPDFVTSYVKNNYPDAEIQECTKKIKGQSLTYDVEIVTMDKKGKMSTKTLSFDDKGGLLKK